MTRVTKKCIRCTAGTTALQLTLPWQLIFIHRISVNTYNFKILMTSNTTEN
jgi:hypothetical protein